MYYMRGNIKAASREMLLGHWKAHILHYAHEGPVVEHRMLRELRRYGYEISLGTVNALLRRVRGGRQRERSHAAGHEWRRSLMTIA